MKNTTHRITEGAMMVAIVGMLLFINRQFAGFLEYAMYWILSFPIMIYTVRYGIKQALVPAVSMLLLSVMISMPSTIFYLFSALLTGLVYGGGVRNAWSNRALLCSTGVLTLVSYFMTMVVFAAFFGYDPNEDIEIAMQLGRLLHIGNIPIGQLAIAFSLLLSVMTALLQTICVHLLAILMMRRMHIAIQPTKSLFDMTMPKSVGYISICIWVLFLLRNVIKLEGNLLVVLISAYCVVVFLMSSELISSMLCLLLIYQKRSLVFVLLIVVLACLVFEPTRNLVILMGIYSCLVNLRTRWKRGVINGTFRKS